MALWLIRMFWEMYAVRDFWLVLCVEVWDQVREYAIRVLKGAVAAERAEKRLDYLPSESLVIYSPQSSLGEWRNVRRW